MSIFRLATAAYPPLGIQVNWVAKLAGLGVNKLRQISDLTLSMSLSFK
jgi:hypothetical protein